MASGATISLAIDRSSRTPIFVQIYRHLRHAIASGRINSETRLPSTRRFARELGVSRSTIVIAYDNLIADGYAEGRRGSAVIACNVNSTGATTAPSKTDGTATRRIAKPQIRPFCPDSPAMNLFPYKAWSRAVTYAMREHAGRFDADNSPFGDIRLREEVARHLYEWRGVRASTEQIIITSGSAEALNSVLRSVARKGDVVAMENPGPVLLHRYAEALGLVTEWLPTANAGATLRDQLTRLPRLIITAPSHRYPIGGMMSLDDRLMLARIAAELGAWIVEDDSSFEFQYDGAPPPSMLSLAEPFCALYVGTFSKVFSHALGLGYLVVPTELIDSFTKSMMVYDQRASPILQRPLAYMMEQGVFTQYLRNMRAIYLERRSHVMDQLRTTLNGLIEVPHHMTGMEITLRFTDNIPDRTIATEANRRGLFCRALSSYCSGKKKMSGLVLGCYGSAADHSNETFAALRDVIAAGLRYSKLRESGTASRR